VGRALFVVSAAALSVTFLLLALRPAKAPQMGAGQPTVSSPAGSADPRRSSVSPRRAAIRPFLRAFLAVESGRGGSEARATLRADSSPRLARLLLSAPPRRSSPTGFPPRLLSVRTVPIGSRPGLALVSGTAHRPSGPEPFAFLFARRHGQWRALAPAE